MSAPVLRAATAALLVGCTVGDPGGLPPGLTDMDCRRYAPHEPGILCACWVELSSVSPACSTSCVETHTGRVLADDVMPGSDVGCGISGAIPCWEESWRRIANAVGKRVVAVGCVGMSTP
jgi:hypothetical protein